ncbi:hypothetical protein Tco_1054395 [Tanacetum coccineum]|uniref:Retrovirus-related Pol polyprotein from transposon TNT 1-94-like beta-barrel domain-containing protein n=1 Tax=Tanacetum coccineum TaxID=301880 RepID=A0ABQ5GWM5_9ASTR
MLGKKPNKVYDPFLKAGLGYTNLVRLKKAVAAQPKMYDGDLYHNNKLVIHTTDSEETLADAEEKLSAEQTYFSIPFTFDNGSTSKDVPSESPDTERRWLSDSQNELREFSKTDVIPMSRSLYKTLSEIKEELIEEVQEMLNIFVSMEQKVNDKSPTENIFENEIDRLLEASLTSEIRNCVLLSVEQQKHELLKAELEKSASDSRDIQANLLKRIKSLENDFQRSQAQTKLSTLHDENVLLKHQVESTVKERENIKLEFQKLFNSIKATRAQHQNEINEMFEDVTQNTYAYADVRAQNQDLLMTISELKSKLKTIDKEKHVNTKFDKSKTLGTSSKTVNDVNDGLNMLCISCGLDVFLHSQEKCVARNALTRKSSVKRALFTSPVTAKSKGLGATFVVAKSRFSVAKTQTATTKVIQLVLWIVDSGCSKHMTSNLQLLRNFIEKFMGTVRFGNDHFTAITGYGDYVQANLTICHFYYVEGLGLL